MHDPPQLLSYVAIANAGLKTEVTNPQTLEIVLGHLKDIRKREDSTDASFEPLRAILNMLHKYGVSIPPEIALSTEACHVQWDQLKRTALNVKEYNQSLQAKEAVSIKSRSKNFDARVAEFRAIYLRLMPFAYSENCSLAYETIDRLHHGKGEPLGNVQTFVAEAERLNELQDSFELEVCDTARVRAYACGKKVAHESVSESVRLCSCLRTHGFSIV